jgi:ribokinase
MAGSDAELVVVGRLWAEYVAHGPRLPKPGETVESPRFEDVLGGRGARQAVAAARLELRVGLIAPLGADDRAESLIRLLGIENVDIGRLRRDVAISTGAALVHVDPWRVRQRMIFPDAPQAISALDVEAAAPAITSARAVLVSLEIPRVAAERAIELAHQARALIILDAVGATWAASDDVLRKVDVLHATAKEAEVLVGVDVRGPRTAIMAAEALRARGLGAALIDSGTEGHLLLTERGSWMFPRLGAPDVDAEVSDEAFVAALAAGRAEGRSLQDAATLASAAQALVSPEYGVRAFPRRDAVLRYLEATTGRSSPLDDQNSSS